MSAPRPNLSRAPLAVLLVIASAACAPDSMTDADTATRPATPAVDGTPSTQPDAPRNSDITEHLRACDAARVDALAGHAATPSNLDLARELSGADSVRVIRPGQPVTEDYSGSRLNLDVNDDDVILRAACG